MWFNRPIEAAVNIPDVANLLEMNPEKKLKKTSGKYGNCFDEDSRVKMQPTADSEEFTDNRPKPQGNTYASSAIYSQSKEPYQEKLPRVSLEGKSTTDKLRDHNFYYQDSKPDDDESAIFDHHPRKYKHEFSKQAAKSTHFFDSIFEKTPQKELY